MRAIARPDVCRFTQVAAVVDCCPVLSRAREQAVARTGPSKRKGN